jgi:hypothetical protein
MTAISNRSKRFIRLAFLLANLACNAALSEVAAGAVGGYTDVVSTVRAGSTAVLWVAVYLTVAAWACGRPPIKESPLMTMRAIWGHVYGLGLLIFVSVYCLLCVNSLCTFMFMASLATISIEEISSRDALSLTRLGAQVACTLLSIAAMAAALGQSSDFSSLADLANTTDSWFNLVCKSLLPPLAPYLYNIVRRPRALQQVYTVEVIVEFIYFAAPFAAILSAVVLCTLSAVPNAPALPPIFPQAALQNASAVRHISNVSAFENDVVDTILLVTAADVAMPLLPVTMLSTLFLAVQCTLHYDTSEFLAPMSAVVAAKALVHNLDSEPGVACIPMLISVAAIALRVSDCADYFASAPDEAGVKLIPQRATADECEPTGVDDDCDVAEV